MKNTSIVKAKIDHKEVISEIHNQAFRNYIEDFGDLYGYRNLSPNDFILNHDNKSDIWLLYLKGKPIGYIQVSLEELHGDSTIQQLVITETKESLGQSMIAILPEHQNQGYGKYFIKKVLDKYKGKIDVILVLSYNNNSKMNTILTQLGFQHQKMFFFERYSKTDLFINDSVLATSDLTKELPRVNMNNNVIIRKLERKDLEDIRQIFKECREDIFNGNPTSDDIENWFKESWGEVTLVAELNGLVVGCMEYNEKGIIGIPGVLLKYRKKGIGSTLFYHLLKSMKENGYTKALADTGYILEDAIALYKRFNFDISHELWAWIKILN